ncbi:MAG TPA: hypothetical protein PKD87_16360 [Burkholderiaceae bacterium]|nr:hypothetical protein [Burkholderiaceae bacterium]
MIDTLKLMLHDYEISSDSEVRVQPASYELGTGAKVEYPLFYTHEKGSQFGSKAYLNSDTWNFTLKPIAGGAGIGAFLQLSVPKNYYGNNFYSVGEQGTQAVLSKVEGELHEKGVHTSLPEADISRADTFKNIEPEEPFSSYYTLFSLLKARRAIQRGYGTTFLLSNSQQEFCVYDKLEEMKQRDIDTSTYPATMRFEHRLLNKAKVQSTYGFTKVVDIFKGGYEVIREKQVESWKNSLFNFTAEEIVLLGSKQLGEEMRVFKEKFPKNWFYRFLRSYGAYYLATYAGKEVVVEALQNFEVDRMKIWRVVKELEKAERELLLLKQEEGSNKTLGTLYEELRRKVCLN